MHDLLLRNGTILDGTGAQGQSLDIAVKDGRIAAVGANLGPAQTTIDAAGHIICLLYTSDAADE